MTKNEIGEFAASAAVGAITIAGTAVAVVAWVALMPIAVAVTLAAEALEVDS